MRWRSFSTLLVCAFLVTACEEKTDKTPESPSPDSAVSMENMGIENTQDTTSRTPDPFLFDAPGDFMCGDHHIRFVPAGESQAYLEKGEDRHVLTRVSSPSGQRFAGEQHSGTDVWFKEDGTLLVTINRLRLPNCVDGAPEPVYEETPDEASVLNSGAPFVARGNEPPWRMDWDGSDSVTLTTDYGDTVHETLLTSHTGFGDGATTLLAESPETSLEITILPEICTDDMSGELFSHTVSVLESASQTLYEGCGGEKIGELEESP